MFKFLKQYPAFILISFLIFSSVIGHSIATSIVVIALAALSAYRIYLDQKEIPDPSLELYKKIDELTKRIEEREEDVKRMKDDFGRISVAATKGFNGGQQIRF